MQGQLPVNTGLTQMSPQIVNGCSDVTKPLPIGERFRVESPVYDGYACLNIRGLPGTNAKLFEGKKRFLHLAFQVPWLPGRLIAFRWHQSLAGLARAFAARAWGACRSRL